MPKTRSLFKVCFILLIGLIAVNPAFAAAPKPASISTQGFSTRQMIFRAKSAAEYAALRNDIASSGGEILIDRPQVNFLVASIPEVRQRAMLAEDTHAAVAIPDHIEHLVRPAMREELFGKRVPSQAPGVLNPAGLAYDPAHNIAGLMWNVERIQAPQAWAQTNGTGDHDVTVAVADTGLDYTHAELNKVGDVVKVTSVVDLTTHENPNICSYYFGGKTDAELAVDYGVSADNDFNGHGTWIGGNIAANLNGTGINGIAPSIQLVALKISQNCGSAYDSTILQSFIYAAESGIDIVSISFGGYLDRSDPQQDAIYQLYVDVVNYANTLGTVIIAAAGNEHTRIGAGGEVLSHGILAVPSDDAADIDYFGLWEVPGGIPGVVMVAATGNVVNGASDTCPVDSLAHYPHNWCKPKTDAHQPYGVGQQNQLAYYSNYGPRIDIAAPGGARKFNLPAGDGGGTEGWPWTGTASIFGGTSTADGTNAWQTFSITSNYAEEIPCISWSGSATFPANECYAIIQGTSMATPHVSAVMALILSAHPELRYNPDVEIAYLKSHALPVSGNTTPPLSATDKSAMDTDASLTPCDHGYCHLGGAAIADAEAYGAGLVDAFAPFWPNVYLPLIAR